MRNFTPYVKEYLLMAAVVAVAWTAALAFALVVNATILSATDEREIRALSSTSRSPPPGDSSDGVGFVEVPRFVSVVGGT